MYVVARGVGKICRRQLLDQLVRFESSECVPRTGAPLSRRPGTKASTLQVRRKNATDIADPFLQEKAPPVLELKASSQVHWFASSFPASSSNRAWPLT